MLKLYEFSWDCGRGGIVEGLFIADESEVKSMIRCKREVYFGEILGKHSDISGTVEEGEITVKSSDQAIIRKLQEVFDGNNISGYNPLDYTEEE